MRVVLTVLCACSFAIAIKAAHQSSRVKALDELVDDISGIVKDIESAEEVTLKDGE